MKGVDRWRGVESHCTAVDVGVPADVVSAGDSERSAAENVVARAGHARRGVEREAAGKVENAGCRSEESAASAGISIVDVDGAGENFEVTRGGKVLRDAEEGGAGVASDFTNDPIIGDGGGSAATVEDALVVDEAAVLVEQQGAAGRDMKDGTIGESEG